MLPPEPSRNGRQPELASAPDWSRTIARLLAAGSLLGVLTITLLPRHYGRRPPILVPFSDFGIFISRPEHRLEIIAEMGANILLFVPLGFLAPRAFSSLDRLPRLALYSAGISFTVETLQLMLPIDRVASTTDVLLNTAGSIVGFLLQRAVTAHVGAPLSAAPGRGGDSGCHHRG